MTDHSNSRTVDIKGVPDDYTTQAMPNGGVYLRNKAFFGRSPMLSNGEVASFKGDMSDWLVKDGGLERLDGGGAAAPAEIPAVAFELLAQARTSLEAGIDQIDAAERELRGR